MIEACQAPDFMLAGNGEALDATGVQQRLSCKLPEIAGYDVSAAAGTAPLSIDPFPTPNNMSNLGGAWRALAKFDPSVLPKYGLISSNQQSVKDSGDRDRAAAEAVGFTTVSYQEAPPQVDNFRPYVENLHGAGVQVLGIQANPATNAGYYKSMADIGYFPKYVLLNGNNYDPNTISPRRGDAGQLPGRRVCQQHDCAIRASQPVSGDQAVHRSARQVRRWRQAQITRRLLDVRMVDVGTGGQVLRVQPDPRLRHGERGNREELDRRWPALAAESRKRHRTGI